MLFKKLLNIKLENIKHITCYFSLLVFLPFQVLHINLIYFSKSFDGPMLLSIFEYVPRHPLEIYCCMISQSKKIMLVERTVNACQQMMKNHVQVSELNCNVTKKLFDGDFEPSRALMHQKAHLNLK